MAGSSVARVVRAAEGVCPGLCRQESPAGAGEPACVAGTPRACRCDTPARPGQGDCRALVRWYFSLTAATGVGVLIKAPGGHRPPSMMKSILPFSGALGSLSRRAISRRPISI